eukprot:tig00021318_g20145.t1
MERVRTSLHGKLGAPVALAARHAHAARARSAVAEAAHESKASTEMLTVFPLLQSKPPALNPAETLTGDEAESFKQSVEAVAAASGVDESAAAAAVARAFGWSNQSYWCGEKENEAPPAGQVAGVLSLLSELGFDADGVKFLVEKFPEVLGLDIEKRLKRALVKLEYDYGISGSTLIGVVKREPRVLGYNLDCGGDCAGECHRCWVRF